MLQVLQKNIKSNFENIVLWILIFAIATIRLPPISIDVLNLTVSTYNIVSVLVLIIALTLIFFQPVHIPAKKINDQNNNALYIIVSLYFLTQTISIINTINSFLLIYKDLTTTILLFLIIIKSNRPRIGFYIKILIITSCINILTQTILYFQPNALLPFLKTHLNHNYLEYFILQLKRYRFFGDYFDELILPFFYLYVSNRKTNKINKLFLCIIIGCLIFITYASNWRSKGLLFLFSLFVTLWIYEKEKIKRMGVIGLIIVIVIISDKISINTIGSNIYDRFTNEDYSSKSTITSRLDYWKEGTNIGLANKIVGVGLGNYFDHSLILRQQKSLNSLTFKETNTIVSPHNSLITTFATTGLLGLITLLILFLYCLIRDIEFIKGNKYSVEQKGFLVIFWGVTLYSLMNPWEVFYIQGLFWVSRAILAKDVSVLQN